MGVKPTQNEPYGETTNYKVRITAAELNVRAGAGTNYKINTTVKKGEVYTIVEEYKGWGKLKSGAGWISLNYTEPYTKQATQSYPTKTVYNCTALNVRKGAGTKYGVVRTIKKGTKVTVYKTSNGWSKISSSKNEWCSSKYLK